MKLDRYKTHFIELVIDKFRVGDTSDKRLHDSIITALDQGDGVMMVLDPEIGEPRFFSRHLMCPVTGISYNEPAPHTFSFNSPQGACPGATVSERYRASMKRSLYRIRHSVSVRAVSNLWGNIKIHGYSGRLKLLQTRTDSPSTLR
jgi:excinuclease UvrABC ATPase subunit